jgi:hypothetical protein
MPGVGQYLWHGDEYSDPVNVVWYLWQLNFYFCTYSFHPISLLKMTPSSLALLLGLMTFQFIMIYLTPCSFLDLSGDY